MFVVVAVVTHLQKRTKKKITQKTHKYWTNKFSFEWHRTMHTILSFLNENSNCLLSIEWDVGFKNDC